MRRLTTCSCRAGSDVLRFHTAGVRLLRALGGDQLLLHHALCGDVLCAVQHLVSVLLPAMPDNILVHLL